MHRTCRSKGSPHRPKCTLYRTVATLARSGHGGTNKLAFSGRIKGKSLKPGTYRALFEASDAAGTSKAQTLAFTIVAG